MKPLHLFISYSHNDKVFFEELVNHLSVLQRSGLIKAWHDRCISPGTKWASKIDREIEKANLILLLISSDFIASDYCYNKEMKRALERHEEGEATVIPIIIRSVVWEHIPLAQLQALPKDARPVEEWKYRDRAWVDVVSGILKVSKGVFERGEQVRKIVREHRDVVSETIIEADELDEDETAHDDLVENWEDTKRLLPIFPEVAVKLAEYRRDKESLDSNRRKRTTEIQSILKSGATKEIITMLTMLVLTENEEEMLKVRYKEVALLEAMEKANSLEKTAGRRHVLNAKDFGIKTISLAQANKELQAQLQLYSQQLNAVGGMLKIWNDFIQQIKDGL